MMHCKLYFGATANHASACAYRSANVNLTDSPVVPLTKAYLTPVKFNQAACLLIWVVSMSKFSSKGVNVAATKPSILKVETPLESTSIVVAATVVASVKNK